MVDAQVWLNDKYPDKSVKEIFGRNPSSGSTTALLPTETLTGELKIENFPDLEEIELVDSRELDKLIIKNCPKLERVNVQDSGVKELEIGLGVDNLLFLDFSFETDLTDRPIPRKVDELDLSNVPNLKVIRCFGEQETKLKGVENLTQLQFFSSGTSVNDTTVVLLPTEIFREWKEGLKQVLGLTTNDLPDTWKVDLASKLGGKNLSNLSTGQTLASLIDSRSPSQDDLQNKLNQAQAELDKKKDYDSIKVERDQLKQNFQEIVQKLKLVRDSTFAQVLSKIEELMNKPDNDNSAKINELESQLIAKNQRIRELEKDTGISKKNIIESLKNSSFSLSATRRAEIVDASNSKEAWRIRDQAIKEKFEEAEKARKNAFYFNIVLGILVILISLGLGYLIIKKKQFLGQPKKKIIKLKK
ncbi:MAG: hypothetical protein MRERC_2c123 [Mycoplasmataceae bacterium RC_NB112A]|nr:MAG: hypothetical protein MRERC_2c123 [Mycoplasmataceae bacterium RC_NB112A]